MNRNSDTVSYISMTLYKAVNLFQGCSQDFHKGGAQLDGEVVIVCGEASHGQVCWP